MYTPNAPATKGVATDCNKLLTQHATAFAPQPPHLDNRAPMRTRILVVDDERTSRATDTK